MCGAWESRLREDVDEDLPDARIVLLSEPEERLLAHLAIGILLRDLDQLVRRGAILRLGQHPDELFLHLRVCHSTVERNKVASGNARLSGGPQRVPPKILAVRGIE